ncbi:MAG: hypothetical protein ABI833_15540 [Acidobacteriota bacterium]
MKANKVHKRLNKIEALVSDLTKRVSASAPHLRGVLKDLKAAFARVQETVSAQSSAGEPKKKASTGKKSREAKGSARARKKKAAPKTVAAKSPKKRATIQKPARKITAKKVAPATPAVAQPAVQKPISIPAQSNT